MPREAKRAEASEAQMNPPRSASKPSRVAALSNHWIGGPRSKPAREPDASTIRPQRPINESRKSRARYSGTPSSIMIAPNRAWKR
jgi:hypothetical protein